VGRCPHGLPQQTEGAGYVDSAPVSLLAKIWNAIGRRGIAALILAGAALIAEAIMSHVRDLGWSGHYGWERRRWDARGGRLRWVRQGCWSADARSGPQAGRDPHAGYMAA
jgi:hypothetical protein